MVRLRDAEPGSAAGFELMELKIPCTCGEIFHRKEAFHGHLAQCDGRLDKTYQGYIRAGMYTPLAADE
jgi:hypothetical protein